MFITKIQLKDFGNVQNQTFADLPDAVAIFGFNGHGKSTVLYALQMLLFGYCDRTDKRGAGADALIRHGAKQAEIAVDIEVDADTVIRVFQTIKRRGPNEWACCIADTGEEIPGVENRVDLWKRLGINMDHAKVAAFPMQMLRSKDFSDPLADYLAADLDLKRLRDLCGDNLAWLTEFAKGRQMSPVYAGLTANPGPNPAANPGPKLEAKHFEDIGAYAFEKRTGLKKELAAAKDAVEAAGHIAPPKDGQGCTLSTDRIPAIEKKITTLQAQLDAIHIELGAAQSAPDAAGCAIQRAAAESALTAAEAAEAVARADAERLRAEYNARAVEVTEKDQALANLKGAWVTVGDDLKRVEKDLAALESPAAVCPTCSRPMADVISAEVIAPRKAAIEALKAKEADTRAAHDAALAALPDLREVAKTVKGKAETAEAKQRDALAAVTRAEAALDAIPVPYDGPSVADLETAIETAKGQQARATEAVATLKRIIEVERNEAFIANAEAQIVMLDWCVKSFQKGEILNQLLGSPVDDFCAQCNAELSPLGYELSIQIDGKNLTPLLRCPGATMSQPVMQCSAGQQTLAAVAIASAFANTGAPMLIDDLNQLDPANRGAVLMRMRAASTGSVVCAATWQQKPDEVARAAAALAPVAAYWVEGGRYTLAGASVGSGVAAVQTVDVQTAEAA